MDSRNWGLRRWRQLASLNARKKGVVQPVPEQTDDSRIKELVDMGLLEIAETTDETKQQIVTFMENASNLAPVDVKE
jgi:hypothetical protein